MRPLFGRSPDIPPEAEKNLETMAYIHPFWNAADPALPPRTASGWGFASRISSHIHGLTAARWRTLGGWQALLTRRGGRRSSHMISWSSPTNRCPVLACSVALHCIGAVSPSSHGESTICCRSHVCRGGGSSGRGCRCGGGGGMVGLGCCRGRRRARGGAAAA